MNSKSPKRSGERTAHRRAALPPSLRYGLIAGVITGVFLVLALRERGPTLEGRGVLYYFPRWQVDDPVPLRTNRQPTDVLREGGVRALPVLLRAIECQDSPLHHLIDRHRAKLPDLLASLVPRPVLAESVRRRAMGYLETLVTNTEALRQITNLYHSRLQAAQPDILRWFAHENEMAPRILPLLASELRSSNTVNSLTAASVILSLHPSAEVLFPEAVEQVFAWFPNRLPDGLDWSVICQELAPWKEHADLVIPLLDRCATIPDPSVSVAARLSLASLVPESRVAEALSRNHLLSLGAPGWMALINEFLRPPSRRGGGPRNSPGAYLTPAAQSALPFLIELAGLESSQALLDEWAQTTGDKSDGLNVDPQLRNTAIRALRNFGSSASNAIPVLCEAIRETNRWIRMSAGMTLLRIGPVSPKSVPDLAAGLANRETVVPLLCLLADYGAAAASAVPQLERLASGKEVLGEVAGSPAPYPFGGPRRYSNSTNIIRPLFTGIIVATVASGEATVTDRYLSIHRLPGKTYNRLAGGSGIRFPTPGFDGGAPARSGPRGSQGDSKLNSEILARLTVAEVATDALREIKLAMHER